MKKLLPLPALLLALSLPAWADSTTTTADDPDTNQPAITTTDTDESATTPGDEANTDDEATDETATDDTATDDTATDDTATDDTATDDTATDDTATDGDGYEPLEYTDDEDESTDDSDIGDLPRPWDGDWIRIWTFGGDGPWPIYTMTSAGDDGDDDDTTGGDDPDNPDDPTDDSNTDPVTFDPGIYYATGGGTTEQSSPGERRAARKQAIAEGLAVVFDFRDANHDNSLSPDEFNALNGGRSASFRRADRNHDGSLSLDEFSRKRTAGRSAPPPVDLLEFAACQATFSTLDFQPKDGFLTFGEYTANLRPSGPGVLERIFAEADSNGDGRVSLFEFCHRPVRPSNSN